MLIKLFDTSNTLTIALTIACFALLSNASPTAGGQLIPRAAVPATCSASCIVQLQAQMTNVRDSIRGLGGKSGFLSLQQRDA